MESRVDGGHRSADHTTKGILNKTEVSLPLNFVQEASVHRPWYGVVRLDISTAAGREGLSRVDSMKPSDARKLADTIMAGAKRVHDRQSGNGTDDVTDSLVRAPRALRARA
jgi:hypothetical protein